LNFWRRSDAKYTAGGSPRGHIFAFHMASAKRTFPQRKDTTLLEWLGRPDGSEYEIVPATMGPTGILMLLNVVKILHTAFVCLLVPVYWIKYGPQNFLWFCDIALLGSVVALWTRSSLVASTQALSVMLFDALWSIDFLGSLFAGQSILGLSTFMFDATYPIELRLLSLFHLWLPWLLVWMVFQFGYDRRALVVQTIVCWVVLVLSYLVSTAEENLNWVFRLGETDLPLPATAYLVLLMLAIPICFYLPAHALLLRWARARESAPAVA
jgi:hypothetical protein